MAVGCGVAAAIGVPVGVWLRNLVAWGAGAAIAVGLARWAAERTELVFLALAPAGLATSFLSADLQGVHRWVDLGPLHLNVAQALLPLAIVAMTARAEAWRWLVAAAVMVLLVLQPDASQATAWGGALAVLIVMSPGQSWAKAGGFLGLAAVIALAWSRPDPLAPVAEVEEIMRLAWAVSPLAAVAAWATLAGACLSLGGSRTPGALALAAYAMLAALMPLVGWFPVPLVGMTMSPIIGLWLGAGLLAAQARRTAPSTCTPAASDA